MARQILGELTEQEHAHVSRLKVLQLDAEMTGRAIQVSIHVFWQQMVKKYDLPEQFNHDAKTGELLSQTPVPSSAPVKKTKPKVAAKKKGKNPLRLVE